MSSVLCAEGLLISKNSESIKTRIETTRGLILQALLNGKNSESIKTRIETPL